MTTYALKCKLNTQTQHLECYTTYKKKFKKKLKITFTRKTCKYIERFTTLFFLKQTHMHQAIIIHDKAIPLIG